MKQFIGAGVLVALALIVRFWAFQRVGLDLYVHDSLRVIPIRVVGFWFLMGIAAVWFSVAAYKFYVNTVPSGGRQL
jgi:riboflavin transporter FmnP